MQSPGHRRRPETDASLSDYAAALRRHWLAVVACTAIALVLGMAFLVAAPRSYTARAVVTINPITANPFSGGPINQQVNTTTEVSVVSSTSVAQLAAKSLHDGSSPSDLLNQLQVTTPLNSQALQIDVSAPTAQSAAARANAFADAYLAYRQGTAQAQAQKQAQNIATQLSGLQKDLKATQQDLTVSRVGTLEYGEASAQRDLLLKEIGSLRQQLSQLSTLAIAPGQVVDRASPPASPSSPKKSLVLAGSILLGLLAGAVVAAKRERRDVRLGSREELVDATAAAVLAAVPSSADRQGSSEVVALSDPDASEAAAYRLVAAKLANANLGRGAQTVLVTGPGLVSTRNWPGANLAVSLASMGQETKLVLGPGLSRAWPMERLPLDQPPRPGAGQVGVLSVDDRVGDDGLLRPRFDARNRAWREIFRDAQASDGFVVVESPDEPQLAEMVGLADFFDAVVLVAEARRTTVPEVSHWASEFREVGATVTGAILLVPNRRRLHQRVPLRRVTRWARRAVTPSRTVADGATVAAPVERLPIFLDAARRRDA